MSEMFDLVTIGRSSIDLYANDIGAAFPDIESFGAFVGGCPLNVAVGAQRLGLRTALVSAVGVDPVGDFLLQFLQREAIETGSIQNLTSIQLSIETSGGLHYTEERARAEIQSAIKKLEILPKIPYKDGLTNLANFAVNRRF